MTELFPIKKKPTGPGYAQRILRPVLLRGGCGVNPATTNRILRICCGRSIRQLPRVVEPTNDS